MAQFGTEHATALAGKTGAANRRVSVYSYDRSKLKTRIVHLGVGAFQRAHQAYFTDLANAKDGSDWGICGVSLRRPDVRDALKAQDFLYSIITRDAEPDRAHVVGCLTNVLFAKENPSAVLEAIADPDVKIVSLTVTEKGYCYEPSTRQLDKSHPDIVADLREANKAEPVSSIGVIVRALQMRMARNLDGITCMSLDNLPQNGKTLKSIVRSFAKEVGDDLLEWIDAKVTFPCSMVDRIVPATTDADIESTVDLLGARDNGVVVAEPFMQWVIEDNFANGRPSWETSGAELVKDVAPYEEMKLRLLNGTHSSLAYLGYLAGHTFIYEVIAKEWFEKFMRKLMDTEVTPTLDMPADMLAKYKDQLVQRYKNPGLKHKTWQIAMDGSQKLPQRLLNTARARIAADQGASLQCIGLAVAAWMRYVGGIDESGNPIDVRDPKKEQLAAIAGKLNANGHEKTSDDLLGLTDIFGEDLAAHSGFVSSVKQALGSLVERGSTETVKSIVGN